LPTPKRLEINAASTTDGFWVESRLPTETPGLCRCHRCPVRWAGGQYLPEANCHPGCRPHSFPRWLGWHGACSVARQTPSAGERKVSIATLGATHAAQTVATNAARATSGQGLFGAALRSSLGRQSTSAGGATQTASLTEPARRVRRVEPMAPEVRASRHRQACWPTT
jgi:hypothetical protein